MKDKNRNLKRTPDATATGVPRSVNYRRSSLAQRFPAGTYEVIVFPLFQSSPPVRESNAYKTAEPLPPAVTDDNRCRHELRRWTREPVDWLQRLCVEGNDGVGVPTGRRLAGADRHENPAAWRECEIADIEPTLAVVKTFSFLNHPVRPWSTPSAR